MINVIHNTLQYEDIKEFIKDQNEIYLGGYTLEDFERDIDLGYIVEITCGTYNGSNDNFVAWELNEQNLYNTILNAIDEQNFYEMFGDSEHDRTDYKNDDWVQDYIEFYDIVVLNNGTIYAINK